MKKIFAILSTITLLCLAIFTLFSCKEELETSDDQPAVSVLTAKGFTMDGNVGTLIVSNDTEVYSFINQISVQGNASWSISTDLAGKDIITTKTIPLEAGNNTVYLLVSSDDGKEINLYTMTVRRRPMYTVSFQTNGGSYVQSQQVEESSLVTEPTTTRAGYTFAGWNYDFTTPITHNVTIFATWEANTNTPYLVEYYLQNLENNEYSLQETKNLTGTTDTTVDAELKTYEHFTFNRSLSNISENINGNGNLVLRLYYTRDVYAYSIANENTKGGNIACTASGNYKYGMPIDLKAMKNTGYDFIGWFIDEAKVSENANYSFIIEQPTAIVAKWHAHENTPYKVEYYLQNLGDDEYTLATTENLTGTTDTEVNAEIKTYEHFIYKQNASIVSGNIDGDGSRILKIFYDLETFSVQLLSEPGIELDNLIDGIYKYGSAIDSTNATFKNYLGLDWDGWYLDDQLLTTAKAIDSFIVEKDIAFIAKTKEKREMSPFVFSSTETTCCISGIIDTTVNEIIVPNYVTNIEEGAFSGCSSVIDITIPFVGNRAGATSNSNYQYPFGYIFGQKNFTGAIASQQWYYGSSLENVSSGYYYIPKSIENITVTGGDILYGAFSNCNRVRNIVLPDSAVYVRDMAFYYCTNLISITIGTNTSSISSGAFSGCLKLAEIYNRSSMNLVKGSAGIPNVKNIYTEDDGSKLYVENNYIFYIDEEEKILISYLGTQTSITIPAGTTEIYQNAFNGTNISNVTIQNGLRKIGSGAFSPTNLRIITIPASVIEIGANAFFYDTNLQNIYYKGTKEQWNEIYKGGSLYGIISYTIHCSDGNITVSNIK